MEKTEKIEAHISSKKKEVIVDLTRVLGEYPIVGVVNMENLPTPPLQKMREQLRGKVVLKMTKKRLMCIALDEVSGGKKGIEALKEYLIGMPAFLLTKENPFSLFKTLEKSKSSAPAKAGQTAPKDIVIPAGSTGFSPGPVIGELGMLGLKTSIENGKVAIKEDKVVVKKGEAVSQKVAAMLQRLKIEPMEIGLDLLVVYEDGALFTKEILAVDEKEYLRKVMQASSWAFNLAVDIAYPTKDTIDALLGKAYNDSKALGVAQGIMSPDIIGDLITRAEREAGALKNHVPV
ncbi:50S ribosomal protein L10 [Candidatus Woesearchaeota archaeon CG_4_10_14_0_8_um_filter_47_5]|nr:MAG: 50S ribosomal protein L10 [Candidatus Woesearchaeota archaeon CG_4_10_14_0_8_um_filter_47_5]